MTKKRTLQTKKREISSPDFWINQWENFLEKNQLRANSFKSPDMWDRMAKNYKRNEKNDEKSRTNEKELVEQLVNKNILFPGAKILDIGCGPGNFAIPFAANGADVVAIDISPKMISRVEKEMPTDPRGKIRTIVADWSSIDLAREDFDHHFDLVFAHMTPAVNSPDLFLKMMGASRNWCFNATWIGQRKSRPLDELTNLIYGEKQSYSSVYYVLALNLLISLGYMPQTSFNFLSWQKSEPLSDVIDYYTGYFSHVPHINSAELKDKISSFLTDKSENSMINKENSGTIGRMAWQVGKKHIME